MQTLPYCEGLEVGPKQLLLLLSAAAAHRVTPLRSAAVCFQLKQWQTRVDHQHIMMPLQHVGRGFVVHLLRGCIISCMMIPTFSSM
jgi:hypothetical protein